MKILILAVLLTSCGSAFGMMRVTARALVARGFGSQKLPTYLAVLEREANELSVTKSDLKAELIEIENRERHIAQVIEKLKKAEQGVGSSDSTGSNVQKKHQSCQKTFFQSDSKSDNYSLASKVKKWDSSMDRELPDQQEPTLGERTFGPGWDR